MILVVGNLELAPRLRARGAGVLVLAARDAAQERLDQVMLELINIRPPELREPVPRCGRCGARSVGRCRRCR